MNKDGVPLLALLVACQPSTQAAATADTTLSQSPAYRFLSERGVSSDSNEVIRARLPYDSISLKRDPCFGTCPQDEATLYRDSRARYVGIRFVDNIGTYQGHVSLQDYARLCYMLDRLGYMTLPDSFAAPYTDQPTLTLTAHRTPGGLKSVRDYGPIGPVELWSLRELMIAVTGKIQWEKTSE
ncbi:MAG: DUF6438 domain-containing protein [Gemmatimonadota bacterium]